MDAMGNDVWLGDGIEEGFEGGIGVIGAIKWFKGGELVGAIGVSDGSSNDISDGVLEGFEVVSKFVGLEIGMAGGAELRTGEGDPEGPDVDKGVVADIVVGVVGSGVGAHVVQYDTNHPSAGISLSEL
jgi:hypothetical protein